jgi:hypothetical protein
MSMMMMMMTPNQNEEVEDEMLLTEFKLAAIFPE